MKSESAPNQNRFVLRSFSVAPVAVLTPGSTGKLLDPECLINCKFEVRLLETDAVQNVEFSTQRRIQSFLHYLLLMPLSAFPTRNDTGVFVSDIVKGGLVDTDGRLTQGDQILSVNGEDVRSATQEAVAVLLKCCVGPIKLEVGRFKAGPFHSERRLSQSSQMSETGSSKAASQTCSDSGNLPVDADKITSEHQDTRTVEFTKGPTDSLGISIAGGVGSPLGDIPIFIAMMNPVGLAAQTQKLKVQDLPSLSFSFFISGF
ncbi:hypothetical protein INR49_011802 [Caranx melampygus]|nr:hypothetical protein INR49_011802 [Caranx melampygus]